MTVRWQLFQENGKKFKVYFTRADTGQAVLLTQFPLASTSTNITFPDQALASPCGLFSITQTLEDGSQETLPSTGAGLPSPGGGDVFGGNQGGCDPDPPPPPGPSGPTWVNTFHHRDHLGSLRVTTDAAGWMLSGHDFYPFGMEVAESGQGAGGPSRMKFTGHERDDLTGLDYMKARYSGWFQASFLIPDPANDVNPRNPQSWNRYAYVRNNPMNLVDPTGLAGDGVSQGEGGGGRNLHHFLNKWEMYKAGLCGPGQTAVNCDTLNITPGIRDESAKEADEANRKEWWQYADAVLSNPVVKAVTDALIAVGDNVSMGGTQKVREFQGVDGYVDKNSVAYQVGDVAASVASGGRKQAASAVAGLGSGAVRHAGLIKNIVRKASAEGVRLGREKISQLARVVERAGGQLRTEVGQRGSVRGVRHSHVEGFGSRTANRHIIHEEQP